MSPKQNLDGRKLMVVRMGGVTAKVRRDHIRRLPLLDDMVNSMGIARGGRLLDVGHPDVDSRFLAQAVAWAKTPEQDYVLSPEDGADVKRALDFFGVEPSVIESQRTAAALRHEIAELKRAKDSAVASVAIFKDAMVRIRARAALGQAHVHMLVFPEASGLARKLVALALDICATEERRQEMIASLEGCAREVLMPLIEQVTARTA